jgi:transcriptional regulator with XRE-family HTH domain
VSASIEIEVQPLILALQRDGKVRGADLRLLRQVARVLQREIAERLGVYETSIELIERSFEIPRATVEEYLVAMFAIMASRELPLQPVEIGTELRRYAQVTRRLAQLESERVERLAALVEQIRLPERGLPTG